MNGGYSAHRIASSGLFALFSLVALALGIGEARPLALATGGSLLSLFVFTRTGFRSALGAFASSLATLADLALLFCALSLTGGFGSPYALLLPAGVALAWHLEGRTAARFYAAVSLLGVTALVTLGGRGLPPASEIFPLLATALAGPALLAALEAPMDSQVPLSLTEWDLAFLKSLYASNANRTASSQRGEMKQIVRQTLQDEPRKGE